MNTVLKKALALILSIVICIGAIVAPIGEALANIGETSVASGGNNVTKIVDDTNWEDQLADITLKVEGDYDSEGTAIVYVMGKAPSMDDLLLQSLVSAFEEVLATHTNPLIKFGITIFSTKDEVALPLTTLEAGKVEEVVSEALENAASVYGGINAEGALNAARDMLKAETDIPANRKHVVFICTGHTYFFDNDKGEDSTIISEVTVSKKKYYLWGDYMWRRMNSGYSSSTYVIPNYYKNDFAKYWEDVVKTVEADQNKYVFTPEQTEYNWWATFYANNTITDRIGKQRYGTLIQDTIPEGVQGIPNDVVGQKNLPIKHAANYERAQYETWVVWNEMQTPVGETFDSVFEEGIEGLGYNCYSVYISMYQSLIYDNGAEYSGGYNSIGHSFMDMLAGGEAMKYFDAEDKAYFDPIVEDIFFTLSDGSYVEDYVGYDDDPVEGYDFDFVTDPSTIKLVIGTTEYDATEIAAAEGATKSYSFKDGAYVLDYYRGNGTTEERFVWTFNENTFAASLKYRAELVGKSIYAGTHDVYTSQKNPVTNEEVTTLYPMDSEGGVGTPQIFRDTKLQYVVPANPTTVVISGTKLYNDVAPGDKTFTFELWQGNDLVESVDCDENGYFEFSAISFSEVGTYDYVVVESKGDDNSIVWDETRYTVEIEVLYDGINSYYHILTIDGEENNSIVFNNYDKKPATVVIEGEKYFDGELSKEEFRFELWLGDVLVETTYNDKENGKFTFSDLIFDAEGTYVYEIKEVINASDVTIDYDEATYTVTVVVTLDGIDYIADVTITNEAGEEVDNIEFHNTTVPKIPAEVVIEGNKYLDDKLSKEEFTFELWYNGQIIKETNNGRDGKFTFSDLIFDAEGEYVYEIKEVINASDVTIKYDEATYTVTVVVTLDGIDYIADVTITNEAGEEVDNIEFHNTTVPKNPATVVIDGNKYFEGELSEKEFTFELWYNGEIIKETNNGTDGKFTFGDLIFDAEGTYVYEIKEEIDVDNVTIIYDESVYTVTVVVTLDGLDYIAEVTVEKNGEAADVIEFYNNAKTIIEEEEPALGSTAETVWTILFVIAMLGIVMTSMKKRAIQ